MTEKPSIRQASCADDYDPNSMSVEAARQFIHRFLDPVQGSERVAIRQALGRVLAAPIISPVNVPSHVNSAMDGYAVRGDDLPASGTVQLAVVGTAFAGRAFEGSVAPGQAVRIMTGGMMPIGSDTVIIQEHVAVDGDTITIDAGHQRGQNVRQAGEDLAIGQVVLQAGQKVRPAELGLIASLGIPEVSVYRRLRVAFFSTGDELRSIGSVLEEGQIYDSNRYTIYGMLERLNVEIHDLGVVPDDPALLEATLRQAADMADAILTSGGVSVGEADYIKGLLDKLGEVVFWKIAMKPGRPLAYGKVRNAHFFGLPGNPVSVMVTFYQFVRSALLRLQGMTDTEPPPLMQVATLSPLRKAPGRTEFQRGVLLYQEGKWVVKVTGAQGSGILRSMSEANCFIILPESQGNVAAGELVNVQLMEGLI